MLRHLLPGFSGRAAASVAAGVLLLSGFSASAYAGVLPDPVQSAVSNLADTVGLPSVPTAGTPADANGAGTPADEPQANAGGNGAATAQGDDNQADDNQADDARANDVNVQPNDGEHADDNGANHQADDNQADDDDAQANDGEHADDNGANHQADDNQGDDNRAGGGAETPDTRADEGDQGGHGDQGD